MSYNYSGSRHEGAIEKQFAVIVYLPVRLERFVAPLRERFDPDYDLVSAHVTLVFPWETIVPLSELSAVLETICLEQEPFEIKLTEVGDFYPESPIIYWRVEPCEQLLGVATRLYTAFDLAQPFKDFIPHVTVGKEISSHRVMLVKDEIASYLPKESFEVTSVDLVSPVAANKWVSVRTFALAAV